VLGKPHHCLAVIERLCRQSVAKAAYRHCQSLGLASLTPRGWHPVAAAWSCAPASRCAWFPGHITTFRGSAVYWGQSVAKAWYRHCQKAHSHHQCFARWQHERCGAGCRSRLAGASWLTGGLGAAGVFARYGHPRRFYIRPHCTKFRASQSPSSFVALYRFAPCGLTQQALCKVACAGAGLSAVGVPRSLARPTRRRLSPWWLAGRVALARRCAQVFGQWPAARYLVCAPPTLRASPLRGIGPARSARPPPRGSLRTALGQGSGGRGHQALRACLCSNVVG
jgi:hypothetical protein